MRNQNFHGFCGVTNYDEEKHKISLLGYYGKQFYLIQDYINRSIYDTFEVIYQITSCRKYIHFYDFIRTDEKKIENTLIDKYGLESQKIQLEIGDGTASFYNYVYHRMSFSEIEEHFRSNRMEQGY